MEGCTIIWDLDGTLLDSYPVIVSSLCQAFTEFGIPADYDEVYRIAIRTSIGDILKQLQKEHGFDMGLLKARNAEIAHARYREVNMMPEAVQTLQALTDLGHCNMIYTHKGDTTHQILEYQNIGPLFREVITSSYGFPRKPKSDAIDYLVEKYSLDRKKTFYVGDRRIDMECAQNAGIGSILYLPENAVTEPLGTETAVVRNLLEILNYL